MGKDVVIGGSFRLSGPNSSLATKLSSFIREVSPELTINVDLDDTGAQQSNLVYLGIPGSRGFLGAGETLLHLYADATLANTFSAFVLAEHKEMSNILLTLNCELYPYDSSQALIKRFINSNDPAYEGKPICYRSDPQGLYSLRRVFHFRILEAAFLSQQGKPLSANLDPAVFTPNFLKEYLEHFKYAIDNPFTPTPQLLATYSVYLGDRNSFNAVATFLKYRLDACESDCRASPYRHLEGNAMHSISTVTNLLNTLTLDKRQSDEEKIHAALHQISIEYNALRPPSILSFFSTPGPLTSAYHELLIDFNPQNQPFKPTITRKGPK